MDRSLERHFAESLRADLAKTLADKLDAAATAEREVLDRIAALTAELEDIRSVAASVRQMIADAESGRGFPAGATAHAADSIGRDSDTELRSQKSLIVEIIRGAGEEGIRANDIAAEFQRLHGKNIGSSVHKQVQRLSKEGKIRRQGEGWKMSQKNAGR